MATVVERFVQFTWLSERLRGGLGQHFGHALSLAHRQIRKDNLDSNDNEMTLVYRVREHSSLDGKRLSASTCLALIDEFTTVHVASINPQSSFPGVSVHLQLKRAASLPPVGSEVVLASKITRLGRTMAFIRAELRDSQDGNLICFGSHVKYLPTGSWILDFFLTGWRISLQPLYGHYFLRDPTFDPDGPSLRQGITSSLVYTGIGRATFEVKPIHTNPLGSMHGGCQSVLMELVGKTLAKEELQSSEILLHSIEVTYLGAAKKEVEVVAEVLMRDSPSKLTMRVEVRQANRDKILSEGVLVWSKST